MLPYEMGPIRPPSEAYSLLIRVDRNCHWNRCEFCPVYKHETHEPRPVSEVLDDIRNAAPAYEASLGITFKTAFLQDADPIKLPTSDLVLILTELRKSFPAITRVTTYARSASLAKKPVEELKELRDAGLTRIHCGFETGYDALLRYMKKGASAKIQIKGGKKVKDAGIELSEYYMPGLGGDLCLEEQPTWKRHAEESARVLNEIDPDFIRMRTLGIPPFGPLWQKFQKGEFKRLSDLDIVKEIHYFIETLEGISSQVKSDHSSNALMELEGKLPEDKERMLAIAESYLKMPQPFPRRSAPFAL